MIQALVGTPGVGACGSNSSAQSDGSKPEQVRRCMDLERCLHRIHLEPTDSKHCTTLTCCTWSPLTWCAE
jgi:hypothetical protein